MDAATLARHALEAPRRPLTLKEALSSVADFRIDRKKKYPKILKRGAGYVISLKGNQSTMHDEIRAFMQDPAFRRKFKKAKTVDNGHGRVEENLAMLRHVVMNVLRLDKSVFGGISVKRKELAWDDAKLLKLMLAA